MRPILCKLHDNTDLIVIPDAQAHVNGHAVLTLTYSLFRNDGLIRDDTALSKQEVETYFAKKANERYLGYLLFDVPQATFTYAPNGPNRLATELLSELIDLILAHRERPSQW